MGTVYSHLSYRERLTIADGRRVGLGVRAIARQLGRDPATVSRELRRNVWDEAGSYDACWSNLRTLARRSRDRRGRRKLRPGTPLFDTVSAHLREGWSPAQIAGRLRRMDADDATRRACHESIYMALYALPRGELRRELLACLRQGRQARRPRSRGTNRRGFVPDDLRIAVRPAEIAERLIPGHWEGDLVKGAHNRSAIGTLVERTSRLVMIARMDGLDASAARRAFEALFDQVPDGLRKTLTYDRGSEMARHAELTRSTGVKVYFADPYSPWQRGSNENMNGLIREYLPKACPRPDRGAPSWAASPRTSSTRSPIGSTPAPARSSASGPRTRSTTSTSTPSSMPRQRHRPDPPGSRTKPHPLVRSQTAIPSSRPANSQSSARRVGQ